MIGIFDSGFGGLSVAAPIRKALPQYDYVYLGDSARSPYGNRSAETVYEFTRQAIEFLWSRGATLIIVGCNSASAMALRRIQQEYLPQSAQPERRILGVVRPLAEYAATASKKGRVGVVGTRGTIASEAYIHEIGKLNPAVKVFQQACPLLVPLVEEGWIDKPVTKKILRDYLRPLKAAQVDFLLLACTHYPLMLEHFQQVMGTRNVLVPHPGEIVAAALVDYLKRHPEIEHTLERNGNIQFFTTDDPQRFNQLGSEFFGGQIKAEKVELV